MNSETRTWRLDGIAYLLDRATPDRIRRIPIIETDWNDRAVWPWTSNGCYTVKSEYQSIHALLNASNTGNNHSSHMTNGEVWKGIWQLYTTPKIRHFCWQVVSNALATKLNLYRRKINTSHLCPICEQFEESNEHCLFLCQWTAMVWFGSSLNYKVNLQSFNTVDNWLPSMFQSMTGTSVDHKWLMTLISYIMWEIWKPWCKFLFDNFATSIRLHACNGGCYGGSGGQGAPFTVCSAHNKLY